MVFVFKPSENILKKMIEYYTPLKKEKNPPYSTLQALDADSTITIYESGKVMFQGISADIDASLWIQMEKKVNNRDISLDDKNSKKEEKQKEYTFFTNMSTMGSDEVGTGDYFGPIVVVATFVDKTYIPKLIELGVNDSKKLTDVKIKTIAPILIKEIPYSTIILSNEEYNKMENKNMNKIKAILHNKALLNLIKNNSINPEKIVIDQFVYSKKYYEHLIGSKDILKGIIFMTKAESQVYSVACASIIARYIFLNEMQKLGDKYSIVLPFGAGKEVDNFAKKIIAQNGDIILNDIAKVNFKNTEKILNN